MENPMTLSQETLNQVLIMLVNFEHGKQDLSREQLHACMSVAQVAEAPQYITEYFARKVISAVN
jgi:hypothetical protein